jgi:hypothetical protein
MHAFTLFLMFDATQWRVPMSQKRFTRRDTVDLFAQENREMYPFSHFGKFRKNEMPGSVRQWTLVALVRKTSLHFDCWKTTDGLERAGYNIYDLRGLLYSHSGIVCLLIQSNCIELQPSTKILIWVAWLSDHPVYPPIITETRAMSCKHLWRVPLYYPWPEIETQQTTR